MFDKPKVLASRAIILWGAKYRVQKKEVNGKGGRRVVRVFIQKTHRKPDIIAQGLNK